MKLPGSTFPHQLGTSFSEAALRSRQSQFDQCPSTSVPGIRYAGWSKNSTGPHWCGLKSNELTHLCHESFNGLEKDVYMYKHVRWIPASLLISLIATWLAGQRWACHFFSFNVFVILGPLCLSGICKILCAWQITTFHVNLSNPSPRLEVGTYCGQSAIRLALARPDAQIVFEAQLGFVWGFPWIMRIAFLQWIWFVVSDWKI